MQRLPQISANQIGVSEVSSGFLHNRREECGELMLSCTRPTSSWRWCCPCRPPVSSSIRCDPRLARYVPPFPAFSPLFLRAEQNNLHQKPLPRSGLANDIFRAGWVYPSPSPAVDDQTPPLHRYRIQLSPWVGVASIQAAPIRFPRRFRFASPHSTSRRDRNYSKMQSPRIRNESVVTDAPPLTQLYHAPRLPGIRQSGPVIRRYPSLRLSPALHRRKTLQQRSPRASVGHGKLVII